MELHWYDFRRSKNLPFLRWGLTCKEPKTGIDIYSTEMVDSSVDDKQELELK